MQSMNAGSTMYCAVALSILLSGCSCQTGIGITDEGDTDTADDTISDSGLDSMPDSILDPDGIDVELSDPPIDSPSIDCIVEPDALGNWMIRFDGDDNIYPSHVVTGHDGRIIVSGSSGPASSGPGAEEAFFWLLEVDGVGDVIDQKIIDGVFGLSSPSSSTSALPLSDCGLLLAGATTDYGPSGMNVWLARLNEDGAVLWQKAAGGPGNETDPAIIETTDGGFLLAATTDSASSSGDTDIWLAKLDADATISWQRRIGGSGDEWLSGSWNLVQAPDGVVYIAFTTRASFVSGTSVLMSLDADGRMLWQKNVSLEGSHGLACLIRSLILDDDSLLIAGRIASITADGDHAWVAKISRTGSLLWQKAYQQGDFALLDKISLGADGGYLVSGIMVIEEAGERQNKLWIASLTPEGEISWQSFIGEWERATGRDIDDWQGQAIHHFDGVVAVGEDETHVDPTLYDVAVARLESDGTFPGGCAYIRAAEATSFETTAVLVDSDILVQDTAGVITDADAVFRDADLPVFSLCPE